MVKRADIIIKIQEYMEKYHMLEYGSKIVMGISGGADSVALLLMLSAFQQTYGLSLSAVHINHGIRQEAGNDAAYVRMLCEQYKIPFYLYEADIHDMAKAQKKTEEEMGREYRFQCFCEVAAKTGADTLALAHHMGDQAETVLFHMARGTDLSGIMGIRPVNEMQKYMAHDAKNMVAAGEGQETIRIIRPLLCCAKKELTDWLVSQNITWQEDVTNQDNNYSRNKIRNEIVPLLEEINERAVSHIAELAGTAGEYHAFFQHMVEEYINSYVFIMKEGYETNRNRLAEQEPVFARAVIYEMLAMVCREKKDLTREHIQDVFELLVNQSGKKVMLPYHAEAVVSYEKLIIRKCLEKDRGTEWKQAVNIRNHLFEDGSPVQTVALPFGGKIVLKIEDIAEMTETERKNIFLDARNLKNNYTKFFDCDTIKDTLYIRTVKPEDYFVMNQAGNRKKLSRYFIDQKIPVDRRQYIMVLAIEQEVLWILGGRRSESFKLADDTRYLLKVTYEGENNEESD